MRLTKICAVFAVAVVTLVAVSVARADSLPDGRSGVGTGPSGSPPCSQFSIPLVGGAIPLGTECAEGTNTTTISLFSSGPNPLVVYSPLLSTPTVDTSNPTLNAYVDGLFATTDLHWNSTCMSTSVGGAAAFECTLTAPTVDTLNDLIVLAKVKALGVPLGDGDCDSDDTIFFIPGSSMPGKGCDVFFTTGTIGNPNCTPGMGTCQDTPNQLFAAGQQLQSTSGTFQPIPFTTVPEPGSLGLIFAGFVGLAAFRRKLAT